MRIQGVIPPPRLARPGAHASWRTRRRRSCRRGFTIDYAGESRQLRTEGSKFLGTFLLSAILIYLVLAAQFESFRDPFIILAGSVPLAIAGALLFSFLGFTTLNIYSQVGLITLVGLVVEERHPDRGVREPPAGDRAATSCDAVIEASGTRLRPILMTTAATVVGHFPLVLATGPGAGARNSIGIMLVTGMIIGTVFTLFVVPSIYVLVARTRKAAVHGGRARAGGRHGLTDRAARALETRSRRPPSAERLLHQHQVAGLREQRVLERAAARTRGSRGARRTAPARPPAG